LSADIAAKKAENNVTPVARRKVMFIAILVTYLVLAVAYGVAMPILEAGDENWHESAVWQIIAGHGLPVLNPADKEKILVPVQEAGQPPLYYLLAAATTFWIHPPSPDAVMTASPNAPIGQPSGSTWHRNLLVHDAAESFPWHGLALAVHLQRLLSTLCGAVTVVAVYALAKLAMPAMGGTGIARRSSAPALLAMAVVAFNPMFLFVSASVDNDAPAIALSTVILVALVRAITCGATPRAAALTGTLLGLAMLSKLSAAAIAAPALAVYLWLAWRARSARLAAHYVAALAIPALLLSGWWFVRNWALYGDPLGLATFVQVAGGRPQALTLAGLLAEAPSIWAGFWGVFGIFDVLLPPVYYVVAKVLLILAGLGLLLYASEVRRARHRAAKGTLGRPHAPVFVLLGGWLVLEALLLVRWTAATEASSGRLLFPALGSVAVLVALGLVTLAGRWQALLSSALTILLALGSALAVPLAIAPAYAAPILVPAGVMHPSTPLGYRYGNLELVGATMPPAPLNPGSTVIVTLYWTTLGPIAQDDVVSIQLFGPAGVRVELQQPRTDAFPGSGKLATSHLGTGTGWVDQVPVSLRSDVSSPSLVHVDVFVYPNGRQGAPIAATTATGQPIGTPDIGRLVYGRPVTIVPVAPPPLAVFGQQIALQSAGLSPTAQAGRDLTVALHWRALAAPSDAYTVFVHIGPADRPPVAQHDQQPLAGVLPTTDWVAGESVDDVVKVPLPADLPPGRQDVYVGLYQSSTQIRLPLAGGATQVRVGSVAITTGGG
jgi:4-amino-4-deoxy-L-arabinose transferase-like glycosyltransferase